MSCGTQQVGRSISGTPRYLILSWRPMIEGCAFSRPRSDPQLKQICGAMSFVTGFKAVVLHGGFLCGRIRLVLKFTCDSFDAVRLSLSSTWYMNSPDILPLVHPENVTVLA